MTSIIPAFGWDYWQHNNQSSWQLNQHWQNNQSWQNRQNNNHYYDNQYNRGISATTGIIIGLGAGVVGYVVGRSTSPSNNQETEIVKDRSNKTKIECKYFDLKIVDNEITKIVKVQKCRVNKGEWKIPE